ncbi:hypothetical protein C5167_005331 [Papaver somniferum]|uniref:F-box domain-containing protein n=1 Tax=Papaver somniferum TaxID=3469 RepID=A0A4Y7JBZ0_PAPSO|nr:F-box protein At5g07610-like [Papaver somniferum]RZC58036.1 hypothetical protein C5167_005331 [Papaver somniferum]
MMNSTASSCSSNSIDDHQQNLVAAIENLSLSSTTATSSSAIQVGNNIDLITEILLCLPIKSLLVFKSVSKQWLCLITDPSFAINHIRRHLISKISGLFFEKLSPDFEILYDFILLDGSRVEEEVIYSTNTAVVAEGGKGALFKTLNFAESEQVITHTENGVQIIENGVRIVQSCNGLLCCIKETEVINDENAPRVYTTRTYIYNPTTRQCKILPPSPFRDVVGEDCCFKVSSISLAFDPIKSPDHYQVICIWRDIVKDWDFEWYDDEYLHNHYIEIYSSKMNSWKKVSSSSVNPFYALPNSFTKSGVYWNGSLHWIATADNTTTESSMYFDIVQELVKPFPFPTTSDHTVSHAVYFEECGGHLYLIEVLASCYTSYNIWKLETGYSGWKLIYKLDLERFIRAYPGYDSYAVDRTLMLFRMVLVLEEDEEDSLSKLVVLVDGRRVISYDLKKLSITEIHTFTEYNVHASARIGGLWGSLHHYIESLACV